MPIDATRGPAARALLQKLDAEDADKARLAQDGDADATLNAAAAPNDIEALLDQVDADVRAFLITDDVHYRSLALLRAAAAGVPDRRSFRTTPANALWAHGRRPPVPAPAVIPTPTGRRRPRCFRTARRPKTYR